jgi:hypothetical protein
VASGVEKINDLGEMGFTGPVGRRVAKYGRANQDLARAFAYELECGAEAAIKAMCKLKGHPLLLGVDVKLRARVVGRRLYRARDAALAVSAESVKFVQEYRKQFLDLDDSGKKPKPKADHKGEVDL